MRAARRGGRRLSRASSVASDTPGHQSLAAVLARQMPSCSRAHRGPESSSRWLGSRSRRGARRRAAARTPHSLERILVSLGRSSRGPAPILRSPAPDLRSPRGGSLPSEGAALPSPGAALPSWGAALPSGGAALPSRGAALPSRGAALPSGGAALPSGGAALPSRGAALPSRGAAFPARFRGLWGAVSARPSRSTLRSIFGAVAGARARRLGSRRSVLSTISRRTKFERRFAAWRGPSSREGRQHESLDFFCRGR